MQASQPENTDEKIVDNAVAEGGAYEVIRKRLIEQGKQLNQKTRLLNEARLSEFGSSDMDVLARVRVRTENNCIARDIVQVGEHLLFGYNVFIGLKKETKIEDVFGLFKLMQTDNKYEMVSVPNAKTFLNENGFVNDFEELYKYYKETRLVQLIIKNGKLLAGFQIGERLDDIRVFRWSVSADGKDINYIDNRGERDIELPPSYDFEWKTTSREDTVNGDFPHVSILDAVFVEATGGDITIKIENNTQNGLGIYSEQVEDETQSIDDALIRYAHVGSLILISILPYNEELTRYFIYNTITQDVLRMDAVGQSCVQLPEDHGIIFPGGYYLQTGEYKSFDDENRGLKYKRSFRSPNGEDILYVFYDPEGGVVGLFSYNLIEKELVNPIYGHGYALAADGRIVVFSAENEATRVHPMQIWNTPYISDEYASTATVSQTFFGRIGNAALVRGVSDLLSISRMIDNQSVSSRLYEELSKSAAKIFDNHYWISEKESIDVAQILKDVIATAELVIDEFEKVKSIRQQSKKILLEAEKDQEKLTRSLRNETWDTVEQHVEALSKLRHQRGHLVTIKDNRYIDVERINTLSEQLQKEEASLSEKTIIFLSDEKSLLPYLSKIEMLDKQIQEAKTIAVLKPLVESIEKTASELDLLSELMATLKVDDATIRTRIIESISQVYSKLNKSKAQAKHKQKDLGSGEAVAQFSAQFKLFSQSIANALGLATTPEKCDEQLSRLLVQLEELESQFSDYDQFLTDIVSKREEIYESFESHKQQLLDERQRKAQSIFDAADRILSSIEKRSQKFSQADELNTYFAADALVMKVRELALRLRDLDSSVKADDVESRFKSIQNQALRSLRDKADIYEEGGNVIKLGPRHKFSVNNQELDLTIIPRAGELNIHLTGTNFYEPIEHPDLLALRDYWDISLESESPEVYRAEYLASLIIHAARMKQQGLSMAVLMSSLKEKDFLSKIVSEFASPRYKEGYEKGVHDHDATLLIKQLLPVMQQADLLRYTPLSRGLAQVYWANLINTVSEAEDSEDKSIPLSHETWIERAKSASQMHSVFDSTRATEILVDEVSANLAEFIHQNPIKVTELDLHHAAGYLVEELSRDKAEFIGSTYANQLIDALKTSVDEKTWNGYQISLKKLQGWPAERWNLTQAWLQALIDEKQLEIFTKYIPEAIAILNTDDQLDRRVTDVDIELSIDNLLGEHVLIENRSLSFSLDSYLEKIEYHRAVVIPAYKQYLTVRQEIITEKQSSLRLDEFKARPLSSFVRNRLINESYLGLIGDNFAKQMGTVGEDKRTDLMGLLMMISPPGYGKTTLMEYVASRLGLIFMKINCPSLGHDVLSLDPQQAPNSTARSELEKLNLALEMGNNVMLYLDDIQHTHAEFLQKFISLCDGTRRIEGVWKGEARTYDMRGRKFCVVMAGNPYTESGEAFKIPDMLANRADIYNLGDILSGMDEQFSLSYIENSLTSNAVLAPLAIREMDDVYKLISMAKGNNIATTDLSHQYSGAEINEIIDIFTKLFVIQEVVLKINKQYIASAAQNDKYRTEPAFRLQGSYRNMNKMTEKVSAVMNESELMQMIEDHYLGEAQLLTTGAEDNLLKLAELRGNITNEEQKRWDQIKKDFSRNKSLGGDDADVGGKIVIQLAELVDGLQALTKHAVTSEKNTNKKNPDISNVLTAILEKLSLLSEKEPANVKVVNQPVPGMDKVLTVLAETIEHSIFPLLKVLDKKLEIDLGANRKMSAISNQLNVLSDEMASKKKAKAKATKTTKAKAKPSK